MNARNIQALANKTQDVLKAVIRSQDEESLMRRTTHTTIRQEMDIYQVIISAIRTTGAAVITFRQEVKQLCDAMAHTQKGEVTPTILPFQQLKSTLGEIQQNLPEGWKLAVSSLKNVMDLYEALTIVAVPLSDGWEAHIKVPLTYQPYGQFELYKVTPIPTHFLNSTAALETEVNADYFALTYDHRLHMKLKDEDIRRCRSHGGKTYCTDFTPLIMEERDGCLYDAFRGNTRATDTSCRRRITRPPAQLYTISDSKWIYILPTAESFAMQCVDEPTPNKVFILQGTGVFTLPLGCSAIGDRYIVPPHLIRRSSSKLNVSLNDMTHFGIHLDIEALLTRLPMDSKLNQTTIVELLEKLPDDRQVDVTLQDLKKRVEEWEIESTPEDTWGQTIIRNTNITFSTIGVIAVVVLIAVLCCKCKKRTKTAQNAVTYVTGQGLVNPGVSQGCIEALRLRTDALEKEIKELREKHAELQRMI